MLIDAIFKLREQRVANRPIGAHATALEVAAEDAALTAPATHEMKGLMR